MRMILGKTMHRINPTNCNPRNGAPDIWLAGAPFLGLQFVGLILCMVFPKIILIAPEIFFRGGAG